MNPKFRIAFAVVLTMVVLAGMTAQAETPDDTQTAVCRFEDGKQIGIRYERFPADGVLRVGQVWPPKQDSILLFTETNLSVDGKVIPTGAYKLFTVPQKEDWTLVINKQVAPDATYDQSQDLVRTKMEFINRDQATKRVKIAMGRVGPKKCEVRIAYGKTVAWAEINQQ